MNDSRTYPFLFLAIAFFFHIVEEYFFGFPEWASSHFGRTTENFFLVSHLPLSLIVLVVCYLAGSKKYFRFLGLGLAAVLLINGIFHALATLFYRQYSPGVVTGILFYPAAFYFVFRYCLKSGATEVRPALSAVLAGAGVSLLIVGSLFVDMPAL